MLKFGIILFVIGIACLFLPLAAQWLGHADGAVRLLRPTTMVGVIFSTSAGAMIGIGLNRRFKRRSVR